ncbi:hypothetical protein [Nonomuraea rhodomycinica]|nr:hypothetical protein [Nonomuraea rhodomycinica]
MESDEGMKRCPDCGEATALSEFGRNQSLADGRARHCKPRLPGHA